MDVLSNFCILFGISLRALKLRNAEASLNVWFRLYFGVVLQKDFGGRVCFFHLIEFIEREIQADPEASGLKQRVVSLWCRLDWKVLWPKITWSLPRSLSRGQILHTTPLRVLSCVDQIILQLSQRANIM